MSEEKRIRPLEEIQPIDAIAQKLGIRPEYLERLGLFKAKVDLRQSFDSPREPGKLILVTGMTPTPAGEGKTTTSIGLVDALNRLGEKAVVALREPSLGPVFGLKGGATGGGRARVIPSDDINLHFTGDMHAVTSAHNLLAAMVDNSLHFEGVCGLLDCKHVYWKRVMDMDDRVLREIVIGIGGPLQGIARETGFDITAASEIMAILCLAKDMKDLKARLAKICVGLSPAGAPVFASQLKAEGAMAALLRDAIRPNLVQTLEGSPAIIHGGPFANIAHGTNSVIALDMALRLADYVVTECGFASDLGAEKFFDIVVRVGHIPPPAACVIVATVRALKYHGGVKSEALAAEDTAAIERGCANLEKHIENIRLFGIPPVVALNRFPSDTAAEIAAIKSLCRRDGVPFALSEVFGRGGEGGAELARQVLESIKPSGNQFRPLYPLEMPLLEKIETVARSIYGARGIEMEAKTRRKILKFERDGFGHLPVCIAKTQYSLSGDEEELGRPRDFTLIVTDASLSSGAGFVVIYCGDIMTMPGLPKIPAAERIDVTGDGAITGIA
jgi:formate--tetrahydrofolate ligase